MWEMGKKVCKFQKKSYQVKMACQQFRKGCFFIKKSSHASKRLSLFFHLFKYSYFSLKNFFVWETSLLCLLAYHSGTPSRRTRRSSRRTRRTFSACRCRGACRNTGTASRCCSQLEKVRRKGGKLDKNLFGKYQGGGVIFPI